MLLPPAAAAAELVCFASLPQGKSDRHEGRKTILREEDGLFETVAAQGQLLKVLSRLGILFGKVRENVLISSSACPAWERERKKNNNKFTDFHGANPKSCVEPRDIMKMMTCSNQSYISLEFLSPSSWLLFSQSEHETLRKKAGE